MKFAKKLEAQSFPDWKNAYVDYRQLKKSIRKIKVFQKTGSFSFFEFISSLINKQEKVPDVERDAEEQTAIRVFYKKLDRELHKVNSFYKTMEEHCIHRSKELIKEYNHKNHIEKFVHWYKQPDLRNLYEKLKSLHAYRRLNMEAFVEILKKFDKVSNKKDSGNFMTTKVYASYFAHSDKVAHLMKEVKSFLKTHPSQQRICLVIIGNICLGIFLSSVFFTVTTLLIFHPPVSFSHFCYSNVE